MLESNRSLDSPALRPELFTTVGKHNPIVRVGIAEQAGEVTHFLPFVRTTGLAPLAGPVPICDYQALISAPGSQIDLRHFLRAIGVKGWTFDHLVGEPPGIAQVATVATHPSHRVVMPAGFEPYAAGLRSADRSMKHLRAAGKTLARDHGQPTFRLDSRNAQVLDAIFQWKEARFVDGATPPWIRAALHDLFLLRTAEFSGVLSTLECGEQLVAAHFGIRSGTTLYYWFPAFNIAFGKYRPGWLLLLNLLENMHALGCDTLDMGPGGEKYKSYFANASLPLSAGLLALPSVINFGRATFRSVDAAVRMNPLARRILRPAARIVRQVLGDRPQRPPSDG